jgi:hypothetical protein
VPIEAAAMVPLPTLEPHRSHGHKPCLHCCHDRYALAGLPECPACDEALSPEKVGRCAICRCSRDIPPFGSARAAYFGLVAATLSLAAAAFQPWLLVGVIFVGFSAIMRANRSVKARRLPANFDSTAAFVLALLASYGVQSIIFFGAIVLLGGLFGVGVSFAMANRIAEPLELVLVPAPFVIAFIFYVLVSRKFWPKSCPAARHVPVD